MNKEEIRKTIIKERNNISNKDDLSRVISNKIINLDIYQKANVIALYNSMNSEVDTKDLINYSLTLKKVLLPRIINNKLEFIKIDKDTKYNKSNFGVVEPIGEIYKGNIDLIIVPGVSFDKEKNRIGYGKGYYDKYLANKDIYKIGICFSKQIVDNIIVNQYDIKMDMIIADDRVYK